MDEKLKVQGGSKYKTVVYSTLPASVVYSVFDQSKAQGQQLVNATKKILINGGANIADKHFITPKGVATIIEEQDVEFLKRNENFLAHEKAGFVRIEKAAYLDPEEAAKTMQAKDASAPKTPDDLKKPAQK